MDIRRYESPAALLIIETNHLEIIDLRSWRLLLLEHELAHEFVECLQGVNYRQNPRLRAVREFNDPSHDILFALLENGKQREFSSETLYPARPFQLWLELTEQCNENCVHCYAESGPKRTRYMDYQLAVRLIDEAAELGFEAIQFTGGDPLLCPFLVELVDLASKLGIVQREVYTNGIALSLEYAKKLLNAGASFAISFYSHDANHHDGITRVCGSHQRTLKAIRYLLDLNALFRLSIVQMPENQEDLDETYEFLQSMGVPKTSIRHDTIHPVGRGRATGGVHVASLHPNTDLGLHATLSPKPTRSSGQGSEPPHCGKLAITPDGTVYPCIFQRWLPLGNVQGESLQTVYERRPGPGSLASEQAFKMCRDRIACSDCRITAYLGSRASAHHLRPLK